MIFVGVLFLLIIVMFKVCLNDSLVLLVVFKIIVKGFFNVVLKLMLVKMFIVFFLIEKILLGLEIRVNVWLLWRFGFCVFSELIMVFSGVCLRKVVVDNKILFGFLFILSRWILMNDVMFLLKGFVECIFNV